MVSNKQNSSIGKGYYTLFLLIYLLLYCIPLLLLIIIKDCLLLGLRKLLVLSMWHWSCLPCWCWSLGLSILPLPILGFVLGPIRCCGGISSSCSSLSSLSSWPLHYSLLTDSKLIIWQEIVFYLHSQWWTCTLSTCNTCIQFLMRKDKE